MPCTLSTMPAAIDQDNYPEHLGNMFILNAGYTFRCATVSRHLQANASPPLPCALPSCGAFESPCIAAACTYR